MVLQLTRFTSLLVLLSTSCASGSDDENSSEMSPGSGGSDSSDAADMNGSGGQEVPSSDPGNSTGGGSTDLGGECTKLSECCAPLSDAPTNGGPSLREACEAASTIGIEAGCTAWLQLNDCL